MLKLNVNQYGLQENKAKELNKLYMPMLEMFAEMETEYNELVIKEISPELEAEAKSLRLRIGKVRINADKARKEAKAEFIRAGNAIQGAYNTVLYAVESKEQKLKEIENHSINLIKEKQSELESERLTELKKYEPLTVSDGILGVMDVNVWGHYINGVKLDFDILQAEKVKVEKERIEAEKVEEERIKKIEEENKRLAIEAEKTEKERQRLAKIQAKEKEARIRKEQEDEAERKRLAKIEADKIAKEKAELEAKLAKEKEARQKIADELEAKRVKEIKEKQEIEAKKQAELNKGDSAKVKDLINDLEKIKTSYTFKSAKNVKKYADVCVLLDKVISHIKI